MAKKFTTSSAIINADRIIGVRLSQFPSVMVDVNDSGGENCATPSLGFAGKRRYFTICFNRMSGVAALDELQRVGYLNAQEHKLISEEYVRYLEASNTTGE